MAESGSARGSLSKRWPMFRRLATAIIEAAGGRSRSLTFTGVHLWNSERWAGKYIVN